MSGPYRPSAPSTDVQNGYTMQSYQSAAPQHVASGARYIEGPEGPLYSPCPVQSQHAQQQHQSGFSHGALQGYGPSYGQSEQITQSDHHHHLASRQSLPLLPPPPNKRPLLSESAQQQQLHRPPGSLNLPHSEAVSHENWQASWSSSRPRLHSQAAPLADAADWGPTQHQQYEQPASIAHHTPLYTQHPLSIPSVSQSPQTTEPPPPSHSLQPTYVNLSQGRDWPIPSQLQNGSGSFALVTATDPSSAQYHTSGFNAHLQAVPHCVDQSPHSSEQSSSSNRASPLHVPPRTPPQGSSHAMQAVNEPVSFSNPGVLHQQLPCKVASNGGNPLAPSLSATLMFPFGGVSSLAHPQSAEPRTLTHSGPVEQSQHHPRPPSHLAQGQQDPSFGQHRYQPQSQHRQMSLGRATSQSQFQHMSSHLRPRKPSIPSSQDILASSLPVSGTTAARSHVPLAPAASAAVQGLAKRCAQAARATRVSRGVGSASGTSRSSMSSVSSAGRPNTLRPNGKSAKLLSGTSSSSSGESQTTASSVPPSVVPLHGSAAHPPRQSMESYPGQVQQIRSNDQYPSFVPTIRSSPDASSQAQEMSYGSAPISEGLRGSKQTGFVPTVTSWDPHGGDEAAFKEQDRHLTPLVSAQATAGLQMSFHQEQSRFHTPTQPTLSSQHGAQSRAGPPQASEAHTEPSTQSLRHPQTQQPSLIPIQFHQNPYSGEFIHPQAYHTAHGGEVGAQTDNQFQPNAQVQAQIPWPPWPNQPSQPASQH